MMLIDLTHCQANEACQANDDVAAVTLSQYMQLAAADLLALVPALSQRSISTLATFALSAQPAATLRTRIIGLLEQAAPHSSPDAVLPALMAMLCNSQAILSTAASALLDAAQQHSKLEELVHTSSAEEVATWEATWRACVHNSREAAATLCRIEQQRPGVLHHVCSQLQARCNAAANHQLSGSWLLSVGALHLCSCAHALQCQRESHGAALQLEELAASAAFIHCTCWLQANGKFCKSSGGLSSVATGALIDWPPVSHMPECCPAPAWAVHVVLQLPDGCACMLQAVRMRIEGADSDRGSTAEGVDTAHLLVPAAAMCLRGVVDAAEPATLRMYSSVVHECCSLLAATADHMIATGRDTGRAVHDAQDRALARLSARI